MQSLLGLGRGPRISAAAKTLHLLSLTLTLPSRQTPPKRRSDYWRSCPAHPASNRSLSATSIMSPQHPEVTSVRSIVVLLGRVIIGPMGHNQRRQPWEKVSRGHGQLVLGALALTEALRVADDAD